MKKTNKKLYSMLIFSILIISAFFTIIINADENPTDDLDQSQEIMNECFSIGKEPDGNWAAAQSVKPSSVTFTRAELYLKIKGSPNFDLIVELREDGPEGYLLDTVAISPSELSSSWSWVNIDFDDLTVSASVNYFIVIPFPSSDTSDTDGYDWGYCNGDLYSNGALWFSRDGGGLWLDLSDNYDFTFRTYGIGGSSNNPPYEPDGEDPYDGQNNVGITKSLSWTGGDPDPGDSVVYDVYFGTNPSNLDLVSIGQSSSFYNPTGNLNYLTTYYWKIVARDNQGLETPSIVWSFTTVDDSGSNNPPYEPSNPNPSSGASDEELTVDLGWSGGDPDVGDSVTYDVYFGNSASPPLLVSDHHSESYDPGNLDLDTQYYWRIIARDSYGETNGGSTWSFTTTGGSQQDVSIIIEPFNSGNLSLEVYNAGDTTLYGLDYEITIIGGIIGGINISATGSIASLDPSTGVSLTTDKLFGLGLVEIIVDVKDGTETYTQESIGIVLGPIIIVL